MTSVGIATTQSLEQARTTEERAVITLAASECRAGAVAAQLKEARAALMAVSPDQSDGGTVVSIRAPLSGPVLRVLEKSERIVAAGTPLLVIGGTKHLEVVVYLLNLSGPGGGETVVVHPSSRLEDGRRVRLQ